jgi:hypothetical protein
MSRPDIWRDTHLYCFSKLLYYINKEKPSFSALVALCFSTYDFALIFDIMIVKNNITKVIVVALLSSTRGGQRVRRFPLPPPLSGNALIYTTVIKMPKICAETLTVFPEKKKSHLLHIIHKPFHSMYCLVGRD